MSGYGISKSAARACPSRRSKRVLARIDAGLLRPVDREVLVNDKDGLMIEVLAFGFVQKSATPQNLWPSGRFQG
jgi:hypothetical protein